MDLLGDEIYRNTERQQHGYIGMRCAESAELLGMRSPVDSGRRRRGRFPVRSGQEHLAKDTAATEKLLANSRQSRNVDVVVVA